jgi:tetratricopeptide (TPR) repeat protein
VIAEQPEEEQEMPGALSWFKQGVKLARQGEYQAALSRFKRARGLSPNWALPYLEIAVAHLKTDNDRKIIEQSLLKAVRLGKEMPRAHYLYGLFLQESARRSEAISEFVLALKLRPSLVDARFRLATLYVEDGRQADGIKQYRLILKQDPRHLGARRNLAILEEQSGQLEEAEEHLKYITQLFPTNLYHLNTLGQFYKRIGWDEKAKLIFAKAQRLDPSRNNRQMRSLPKSRDRVLRKPEW